MRGKDSNWKDPLWLKKIASYHLLHQSQLNCEETKECQYQVNSLRNAHNGLFD